MYNKDIYGSRDTIRESFKLGLIENGDNWMDMINSRNQTSHTYNEGTADEIVKNIQDTYIEELLLPYTFDISIFNQISNPELIDRIQRVGVIFYQR